MDVCARDRRKKGGGSGLLEGGGGRVVVFPGMLKGWGRHKVGSDKLGGGLGAGWHSVTSAR